MSSTGLRCLTCGGRLGVSSTVTRSNTITRYRKCLQCNRHVISEENIVRDGRALMEDDNGSKEEDNKESGH